jgi:hypothetical protein
MADSPLSGLSDLDLARMYGVYGGGQGFSADELAILRCTGQPTAAPPPITTPVVAPPPQVALGTPPLVAPPTPIDPAQLAAVLYDKTIPIGFSTRAQWGGRIIEGPVFGVVNNERVASFIAGYYIPINFWDTTRTVSELYFRGQLAWSLGDGALMSGLNVGVATSGGNATVRFNTGTLSQQPDAWSIARYGADLAIAYVPLVTATFENIRLAQFDNTVPFTSVTVDDDAYGTPGDLVAWADAIEALALYDGRGPDEFQTVDVSGGMNALILGNNITFTDFLAAMRKHKPQWNVRTADKLYLVEKGLFSLDLTLDQAKLVSHGAQPIVVHSSDAFDKPREKICHYLDVARDYEPSNVRVAEDIDPVIVTDSFNTDSYDIPVASMADIVMTETSFAYYTGEVARRQSEFSGMAYYLGLEPGDCYKWTTAGGRALYHRVNEIVRRADFTIDVKGEGFLSCAIDGDTEPPTPGPYAGWDPATAANVVLSGGNLIATNTGTTSADQGARVASGSGKTSGKFYYEVTFTLYAGGNNNGTGIGTTASTYADMGNLAITGNVVYRTGLLYANGATTGLVLGAIADGDIVGIAVDLDNRKSWFRIAPSGDWNAQAIGLQNPATNTGGIVIPAGTMVPFVVFGGVLGTSGNVVTANFGASAFSGTVPSGFTSGWLF